MLATHDRALLLDALRPPEGYRFDCGVGTTFTLDLLSLMVAPLSLAMLDITDAEAALADPLLLLEGLRRQSEHLSIFCQVGRIAIPRRDFPLFHLLEKTVVEVQAPRGGAFHPKVWLLRYTPEREGAPPLYRFLNLSRNLTSDRSWDLMLWLEGEVVDRQLGFGRNRPLADWIQALPGLAVHKAEMSPHVQEQVDLLQREVRRVAFQPPTPFAEDLAFYPSGLAGHRGYRFDEGYQRVMVISPFLTDSALERIATQGGNHVLISRPDSLGALRRGTVARFQHVFSLDDPLPPPEEPEPAVEVGQEVAGAPPDPSGLHAKLLIMESGWNATWLVGSANATAPALLSEKNVELMVGLRGLKSQVGIDQVMGEGDGSLRSLLQPYTAAEEPAPLDEAQLLVEAAAEKGREWLVASDLWLEVGEEGEETFRLALHAGASPPAPGESCRMTWWPISLRSERAMPLRRESLPEMGAFSGISLLGLTPFVAFRVVAEGNGRRHEICFVLKLPASGMPEAEREARVFRAVIADRMLFQRYLWLLLLPDGSGAEHWMVRAASGTGSAGTGWALSDELPLLELLMRALSRSADKIDRIASLVDRLKQTPEGRAVLPDGFEVLWEAVLQARKELR